MKKIISWLLLLFCVTAVTFGAEAQKEFSIAVASEIKTFKAKWSYNCPAGLEIHFKLYMKDGNGWKLIKEMKSYCTTEEQQSKSFEELFEAEVTTLGEDYTFGVTAINGEGTESDFTESTIHIPLPKPEAVRNFEILLVD